MARRWLNSMDVEVGANGAPLAVCKLPWMAEARGGDPWAHTSAILTLITRVNRDPGERPSLQIAPRRIKEYPFVTEFLPAPRSFE